MPVLPVMWIWTKDLSTTLEDDYVDNTKGATRKKKVAKKIRKNADRRQKAPPQPTIRKAIKLATHPGEAEAKVAMRMATKLMQSQTLTQADLIANETEEERCMRAGHSCVTITSTGGQMVRNQRWYDIACGAACEAFDVQTYSEAYGDCEALEWVFYGLADDTVAAALSFEMLHNQIESWVIEKKEKGELKGLTASNSYRIGVCDRVLEEAQNENRRALLQAEADEKKRLQEEADAARAAEISRLSGGDIESVSLPEEKPLVSEKIEEVADVDAPKPHFPTVRETPKLGHIRRGTLGKRCCDISAVKLILPDLPNLHPLTTLSSSCTLPAPNNHILMLPQLDRRIWHPRADNGTSTPKRKRRNAHDLSQSGQDFGSGCGAIKGCEAWGHCAMTR
ncbi:hypothetical protein H0H81_002131 [Sphagnurus paluster]|uniref:DUF7168 domain-containing protein n=1 Tax=Sphagnurus paluster TaxID=117069 RepID=A0A9P7GM09_9AGAR|nr:hypothetical protein H0H81_002131 [Sphagnurus paluster]